MFERPAATAPAVFGITVRVPDAGSGPDQPPVAVQDAPAVAVQLSSALSPREMLAGCTASVTEGAGAAVSGAEYEPLQAANNSAAAREMCDNG